MGWSAGVWFIIWHKRMKRSFSLSGIEKKNLSTSSPMTVSDRDQVLVAPHADAARARGFFHRLDVLWKVFDVRRFLGPGECLGFHFWPQGPRKCGRLLGFGHERH